MRTLLRSSEMRQVWSWGTFGHGEVATLAVSYSRDEKLVVHTATAFLAHCDDGDGNRLPLSYAVGAVIAGVVADRLGISSAMWLIAALIFVSGLFVFLRMRETNAGALS